MGTSDAPYTPSNPTDGIGMSVSLKINGTSVMLYRNRYLKGEQGKSGMSAQEYLCAFSVQLTDIPPDFHEKLRQATTGHHERYEKLLKTIHTRVLEPARKRQKEREWKAQREEITGWLSFAHQQLRSAASYPHRESHLGAPEIQDKVQLVLQTAQRLQVTPTTVDEPKPQAAPASTQAEEKLYQLLVTVNDTFEQIKAMVPMSGNQFGRGYEFSQETVQQVQQIWFTTSDALGMLNRRQQFKRPPGWSEMRQDVMSGNSTDAALGPGETPG